VQVDDDGVFLRSLIVQMKIIPLPVFLETATEAETREVIISLGHCIRNNAATNIFNKDLDSRNYGVGRYGRVFLFDYDAVEKLTDVKIRTNSDREPGEEAVPDWFFEDGNHFPARGARARHAARDTRARRIFREENADLLTVEYWEDVQQKLLRGEIPGLRVYPDSCKLHAIAWPVEMQPRPRTAQSPAGPWNPGSLANPEGAALAVDDLAARKCVDRLAAAEELHSLTGFGLSELVVFRPQRLALHELLIRVTADFAVPDGSHIGDLGINFRRIASRILARYWSPRWTRSLRL
jgi:hypothetical protein